MKYIPLLFLIIFISCSQKYYCGKCTTMNTVIKDSITVKDSIVEKEVFRQIPADSALYYALLECQNGKVVIKDQLVVQGKKTSIKSTITPDGRLNVKCNVDTAKVVLKWLEHNKITSKVRVITQTIPLSDKDKYHIRLGKLLEKGVLISIILIILAIIGYLIYRYRKIMPI